MIELYNDDCLNVLKRLPSTSVDLVILDPPYKFKSVQGGGSFGSKNRKYLKKLDDLEIAEGYDMEHTLPELLRIMKKVNIYIWCNKDQIYDYMTFFKDYNFDLLVWHKTNPSPMCNNKYLSDLEYILFFREDGVPVHGSYHTKRKCYITPTNKADNDRYGHPTVKPLNIIENFIENSSVEGDTVLDCFMGSGTTGVACKNLNRNFIGIEIEKKYFDIAKDRIGGNIFQIMMKTIY